MKILWKRETAKWNNFSNFKSGMNAICKMLQSTTRFLIILGIIQIMKYEQVNNSDVGTS